MFDKGLNKRDPLGVTANKTLKALAVFWRQNTWGFWSTNSNLRSFPPDGPKEPIVISGLRRNGAPFKKAKHQNKWVSKFLTVFFFPPRYFFCGVMLSPTYNSFGIILRISLMNPDEAVASSKDNLFLAVSSGDPKSSSCFIRVATLLWF